MRGFWTKLLFTLTLDILWEFTRAEDVVSTCQQRCRTDGELGSVSDQSCNASCRVKQCSDGCQLWKQAIREPCFDLCGEASRNRPVPGQVLLCETGCGIVVDIYAQNIKAAVHKLDSPVLVAGSLGSSSVMLRWDSGSNLPEETSTRVQLKQVVPPVEDWEYHDHTTWLDPRRVKVTNLHPYVTYKFRITVVITPKHLVHSPESVPISTRQDGVPSSPPRLLNVFSTSSSIHVTWKSPLYTNGELLAYQLTSTALETAELPKVKVIEVMGGNEVLEGWITGLRPDTLYSLTLSALNMVGWGPDVQLNMSTKPRETGVTGVVPYLVFASGHFLYRQNLRGLLEYDQERLNASLGSEVKGVTSVLYESDDVTVSIQGVAVHFYEELVYFSDTSGAVHCLKWDEKSSHRIVYHSSSTPGPLVVDWLHDKLYIVEDSEVVQCELEGSPCRTVLRGLHPAPTEIIADPINGFLYWAQVGEGHGLYRMDLADVGKPFTDLSRFLILPSTHVAAFTVDFNNFLLFFPDHLNNTMMAANLDGTDVIDARPRVQQRHYDSVRSLVTLGGKFFWSTGRNLWEEFYDGPEDMYFPASLVYEEDINGLRVWHPQAQPKPVPLTAPLDLQALFTSKSATLEWDPPPPPLGVQRGHGAWEMTWLYHVEMAKGEQDIIETFPGQNVTQMRCENLLSNTVYSFRVRACSEDACGPWSEPFEGLTLRNEPIQSHLLYADDRAIYQTLLDGTGVQYVMDLPESANQVRDFVVYLDRYIWSTESGATYVKDGLELMRKLTFIDDASALEYDWLSNTLYWFSPLHHRVERCHMGSHETEIVYQCRESTIRDLALDSVEGYVYWTTSTTVEVIRLDGKLHRVLYRVEEVSGKYVLGLTLDLDAGKLYWMMKTAGQRAALYNMNKLLKAKSEESRSEEVVAQFDAPVFGLGHMGLYYYSYRLYWLSSNNSVVVIMDTRGLSVAHLNLPSSGVVKSFTVVDPFPHRYLGGSNASVDPPRVDGSSIHIGDHEPWDNFTLVWTPVAVPDHQVTYRLQLSYDGHTRPEEERTGPSYAITFMQPYTNFTVNLKACTMRGCSISTTVSIHSPMTAPSPPRNLRTYVTYRRPPLSLKYSIEVEAQWMKPERPNGVLTAYHVYVANTSAALATIKNPIRRPARITKLKQYRNQHYYFQVVACNPAGCSYRTPVVQANTTVENPIPRLMTANGSNIVILYPDEKNKLVILQKLVKSLAFLAERQDIYYLTMENQIARLDGQSGRTVMMLSLNSSAKSLALDWVGLSLYWIQQHNSGSSAIMRYDLSQNGSEAKLVLGKEQTVESITVDPYQSSLFWSESAADGQNRIMQCNLDGSNQQALFTPLGSNHKRRKKRADCNCPNLQVRPTFVLDHSKKDNMELFVVEQSSNNIWAADEAGCRCRLAVNATEAANLGLPPDSMSVDHQRLYWFSRSRRALSSVDKRTGYGLQQDVTGDLREVIAIGTHLQPMPAPNCLRLDDYQGVPQLKDFTTTSLTLVMVSWEPPSACRGISLPTVWYTVHVRDEEGVRGRCTELRCKNQTTYGLVTTVDGLEPYQKYYIQVRAHNYYSNSSLGPVTMYQTAPGIPSAPTKVQAVPMTPEQVLVSWEPPEFPRGRLDSIRYEVEWRVSDGNITKTTAITTGNPDKPSKNLHTLLPNTTYKVKVVAYDQARTGHSASREVTVTTYEQPGPIHLLEAGTHSMTVGWNGKPGKVSHCFFFIKQANREGAFKLSNAPNGEKNSTFYNETFTELLSNTEYEFRIRIKYYETLGTVYIWPSTIMKDAPRFVYKTLEDVPLRPFAPRVSQTEDGVDLVSWSPPPGEDVAGIVEYHLLAWIPGQDNWTLVYNGTDTKWVAEGLDIGSSYVFQLRVRNQVGWSPYSVNSSLLYYRPTWLDESSPADMLTLVLGSLMGIVLLAAIIAFAVYIWCKHKEPKHLPLDLVNGIHRIPDVELATLRELPHITTQQANALYAIKHMSPATKDSLARLARSRGKLFLAAGIGTLECSPYNLIGIIPTDEDVAALPHFRRDQLQLTKFLGSGAFGEVFEGLAKNILSQDSGHTRVAVKTLRKGATDQEKEEFLKEAVLMSNFSNEHILRLLGVCLDNDPQFIILELMEGGDLLTFLRSSRPTQLTPATLSVTEMVSICADVARGCKYLEDLHFVHRDLAARNCLVSSHDPQTRRVKIGDFGLARDIYKNDYYRKEGEGLLPVRWMCPESLIDGVFTTQSDVWAFGVLMWEVYTLGQQPYPARTNIEVLHYVRSGGRLDRPDNCPDDLYHLMLKCWSYSADDRPSFHFLLEQLEGCEVSGHVTDNSSETESQTRFQRLKSLFTSSSVDRNVKNLQVCNPVEGEVHQLIQPEDVALSASQPTDDHGYLKPVTPPDGRPKYLELLNDPEPVPAPRFKPDPPPESRSKPESTKSPLTGSRPSLTGSKLSLGSSPSVTNKLLRPSPARTMGYAQLSGDGEDSEGEMSPGRDTKRPKPASSNGNGRPKGSKLNYSQLSNREEPESPTESDSDSALSGSTDPGTSPRQDKLTTKNGSNNINYAQLATAISDSDIDMDSEATEGVRSPHSPGSACTSDGESGKRDCQSPADVRSKITGDTDLTRTGLWARPKTRSSSVRSSSSDSSSLGASPTHRPETHRESGSRVGAGTLTPDGYLAPRDSNHGNQQSPAK